MKKVTIALMSLMLVAGVANAQQNRNAAKAKTGSSTSNTHKKKRGAPEEGKKFNFSLGISLAASNTVKTTLSEGGGTATITRSAGPALGIFAYPKYSFYSTEKYSLSIGIPLTIAFSGSASSTGESSSSFLYDLPLMVDYNGGVMCPANRHGESRIGYFAGVGIGIENTNASSYELTSTGYSGTIPDYTKVKSVGPNIEAGGVLRIGSEDHPRFIGVRLSYKIGLNTDKFNYFTPSVFLNF